jgi:hypothetical protein
MVLRPDHGEQMSVPGRLLMVSRYRVRNLIPPCCDLVVCKLRVSWNFPKYPRAIIEPFDDSAGYLGICQDRKTESRSERSTLKEIGITKDQASRYQQLASR